MAACSVLIGCATSRSALKVSPVHAQQDSQKLDVTKQKQKADDLYKSGAYREAFNIYQVLLLRLPKDHELRDPVYVATADSALLIGGGGGKYKAEAARIYKKLAQRRQDGALSCQIRAGLYLSTAKGDPATIAKDCPDDARIWNAYGRTLDQKRDWIAALDAYMQALSITYKKGGNRAAVLNNMGMSLLMQGRRKEALDKFSQAIDLKPSAKIYKNNQRLALMLMGKTEQALDGVTDTRMAVLYNDAGFIAANSGDRAKAKSFYERAIEISPVYFEKAVANLAALEAMPALAPFATPGPPKTLPKTYNMAHAKAVPVPSLKPVINRRVPNLDIPVVEVQTAQITPVTVGTDQLAQNP